MVFELRLTFFGLTGLVPNKKAGTPGDPKEWLVVMPALPNGKTLEFRKDQLPTLPLRVDQPIPIAPHQAVLVTNAQAVKEGTTKEARLRIQHHPPKIPKGEENEVFQESDLLFQLDREAVEVEGDPDPEGVKARTAPLDAHLPNVNNPEELHHLKWLPQIDNFHSGLEGGVPFDSTLFDSDTLLPKSSVLAAVVRLDRGILETSDVYRKSTDNQPVPYEFRNLSGGLLFEQALAESFRLRITVKEETATLVLTNQDGEPKHLVVGPYEGCPEEDGVRVVEVKVYNRELEEILGFGSAFLQKQEVPDLDFLIFYSLSPAWSKLKAADLVTPQLGGKGGGGRSKPCEPPTFPGLS